VVAANGTLRSTADNGATSTYVWQEDYPVASYLVTVDIADYNVQTAQGPNGLPLRYYFPRDLDTATWDVFNQTPDMISLFSRLFGPFPFDSYGAIVVDADLGFALETQTRSLFGRQLGTARTEAGEVVAHE